MEIKKLDIIFELHAIHKDEDTICCNKISKTLYGKRSSEASKQWSGCKIIECDAKGFELV